MTPTNWCEQTLDQVMNYRMGFAFRSSDFVEEGIQLVRMANLYRNRLNLSRAPVFLPETYVNDYSDYVLRPGDLVMSLTGTMGKQDYGFAVQVPSAVQPLLLNQRVVKLESRDGFNSAFILHLLQSDFFLTQLYRLPGGTKQANLSVKSLLSLSFPFPPLSEQNAIATILSTWDRGIRQLTDLIAAKIRFKQGLMQQLLTGQRRFPGFNDDWKHVRIGDVAREISERNPDGDSIPVLSCTKYDGLVDSLEYFGKRVFSENTDNYKVVRRNDFAYATNHIEEGSIGLLKHADAGLVSPMYTVFRTNGDVNPDYLYRVLKTETLRQVFASFTSASVNRRGSLRWKQFSTIPLELPSVDEQCHINKAMSAFDREVKLLRNELEAIKQQKKGLMQKLLTGQVQVSLEKHMTQEFGSATS